MFSAIIFSAMIVGEAMSYLGDYAKATMSAAKILKLIYTEPPIDAYSDKGLKDVSMMRSIYHYVIFQRQSNVI